MEVPQKMLEIVPANVYVFVLFWRLLSILWRGAKYTLSPVFFIVWTSSPRPFPGIDANSSGNNNAKAILT